ncbi:hypothetical protein NXS19_002432 [Fusarium pseudograminearum]|nr:hypothetical protein NXS19_002432 [Fusarium pseudograminearum]
MTTVKKVDDLPVGFIAISLGLNWMLMLYFGAKLRRFKIWLYPLMFILNPFYNWYYMVYGIFTAGQRTWGGPRADAAAADSHTTAREAAEQAEKQGDELNVVPETFKAAHEARRAASNRESTTTSELGRTKSVIRPPGKIDGKFSARQKTASGTYAHPDEIDISANDVEKGRRATRGFFADRDSLDSIPSVQNIDLGVSTPRRMKLLMNEEDLRKYQLGQQIQNRNSGIDDAEGIHRQPIRNPPTFPHAHSASANDIPLHDLGANDTAAQGSRSEDIQRLSEGRGIGTRADNGRSRNAGSSSFASRMAKRTPKTSR